MLLAKHWSDPMVIKLRASDAAEIAAEWQWFNLCMAPGLCTATSLVFTLIRRSTFLHRNGACIRLHPLLWQSLRWLRPPWVNSTCSISLPGSAGRVVSKPYPCPHYLRWQQ